MTNRNEPMIRFKNFMGTWKQHKLGDTSTITAGGDVDKKKLLTTGKYPVLANALTNNGVIGYYQNDFKVEGPAVTVTGRGDIGHAKARYFNFTPVVRLLTIKSDHNSIFLENLINNYKVVVESTGVPQLTSPQLGSYRLFFPTLEEQNKIGNLFELLDNIITLQERKLILLKEQKKGFLQKMFPKTGEKLPELRFKGFIDPWEQRKFSEIVNRVSKSSDEQGLPRVEYEDIISGEGVLNKDIFEKVSEKKGTEFLPGDTLYGKLRPYLKNWLYADFKGIAVGDFWVLRPIDSNNEFVYSLIQSDKYQLVANQSSGTKMPRSDWSTVSNTEFLIPNNLDEQKKVGTFFKTLEDTIALQERKLELLKEQKKAFLQKMFV